MKPRINACACNSTIWETEAGGSNIQGLKGSLDEILPKKQKKEKKSNLTLYETLQ